MHCAAGLHRTGTLGYTLLRLASDIPMSKEEAYAALKVLREDTWREVGDWRIDVAERFLVTPILEDHPEDPSIPDNCPAEGIYEITT